MQVKNDLTYPCNLIILHNQLVQLLSTPLMTYSGTAQVYFQTLRFIAIRSKQRNANSRSLITLFIASNTSWLLHITHRGDNYYTCNLILIEISLDYTLNNKAFLNITLHHVIIYIIYYYIISNYILHLVCNVKVTIELN